MHKKLLKKTGAAILSAAMVINSSVVSVTSTAEDDAKRYEFEDAVISGDVTVESNSKASGGSCLKMTESGTISMNFDVPESGIYTITIYAGGIGSAKQQNLSVNGISQGVLAIPKNDTGFDAIEVTSVKLGKGVNNLQISKSWGWSNFDYFTVATTELPEIKATQTTPSDPNATAETQSLMKYLSDVYGKHIISGQQEIYSGGPHGLEQEFEYLNDLTGHYPAIRGFDYGNFCCPCYGSDDGSTDRVIDWVKNKNGIATASFHLNVPKDFASYTLGSHLDWSATTYGAKDDKDQTKPATDFSPSKAATEGTKDNKYYLQSLEVLAAEFSKLQDEGIPVIWRPLHEAEGGGGETGSWFWWGKEGSEAYKELWVYTYKTLTEDFGIHNLIWEWNSYDFSTSADWYPGDEYVDIIGYDKYNCTEYLAENNWAPSYRHNDSSISSTFYSIMKRYDSAKMVSMAENDCFSTVENLINDKAGWLYFCTWYDGGSDNNNFLTNPLFNTEADTIAMYQSDYCITLDELPADLYSQKITPPDPSSTTTTVSKTTTSKTTTTTAAVPEGMSPAKISTDTMGMTNVVLPKASSKVYINLDIPKEITYANGCLGASIAVDGKYYWVNAQWEATKSGIFEFEPAKSIYNITLADDDTNYAEDEAVLAAVTKALNEENKNYQWQKWYAQDATGEATDADGIKLLGVYVKDGEPVTDILIPGDANDDGDVTIDDAVLIMQALANPDKYGVGGTDENAMTAKGKLNADCYDPGSDLTAKDALAVQKKLLGSLKSLPELADQ